MKAQYYVCLGHPETTAPDFEIIKQVDLPFVPNVGMTILVDEMDFTVTSTTWYQEDACLIVNLNDMNYKSADIAIEQAGLLIKDGWTPECDYRELK